MTNGDRPITAKSVQFIMAILIPLLCLAVSWGVWITRVDSLECKLAEQSAKIERYDSTLLNIQIKLAEIQRDTQYLRERLDGRTTGGNP